MRHEGSGDEPSVEDSATVSDSPAAQRRERRNSGVPPEDNMSQSANSTTAPIPIPRRARNNTQMDPEAGASAVATRSGSESVLASIAQSGQSQAVLFQEDVGLMRTFSTLVGVLCLFLVVSLPFLGGNTILRYVLWGGSFFSIFTSLWIVIVLKDVERYDQSLINLTGLLSILIVFSGVLYLGVHSPGSLIMLPGLHFVARSQTRAAAIAMYAFCASMQGALAALIMTGTITDPGLITAGDTPISVLLITQMIVQMMYLGSFILARKSREGTLVAMEKIAAAQVEVQQREAAFMEVREDLARVMRAGGVGHYSNQRFGPYQIGGIIGRGAMGEVYEAVHIETGQLAAAKLLHPQVLAKPSSVDRFLREAQAAASLHSPHSVQVFACSESGDEIPYLIMERLQGYDLAHHLREVRKMSVSDAALLVRQIGSVIDMASAKGIVHRDLKPQNIFLAETAKGPTWKVLDYGASKLAEHSGTLTQGRVIGTPAYMSPQQARGHDVDGAADRYCLAAIVYRVLTGRPPYSAKDLPTTLYSVVYGTPPQPSVVADLDPALDLVLAIGLAKEPKLRFGDSIAFADALEAAERGEIDPGLRKHALKILEKHPWGMLPEKSAK